MFEGRFQIIVSLQQQHGQKYFANVMFSSVFLFSFLGKFTALYSQKKMSKENLTNESENQDTFWHSEYMKYDSIVESF